MIAKADEVRAWMHSTRAGDPAVRSSTPRRKRKEDIQDEQSDDYHTSGTYCARMIGGAGPHVWRLLLAPVVVGVGEIQEVNWALLAVVDTWVI